MQKKQWQQTKKGEFWQIDDENSFEAKLWILGQRGGGRKIFLQAFSLYLPAFSRVPWNNDAMYDDQYQSRGENTDEKEIFMTETELKLKTGIDQ